MSAIIETIIIIMVQALFTGLIIVISNRVNLKWIKSTLDAHETTHKEYVK